MCVVHSVYGYRLHSVYGYRLHSVYMIKHDGCMAKIQY